MMSKESFRGYHRPKDARTTGILVALLLLSSLFNISLVILMFKRSVSDVQVEKEDTFTPKGDLGEGTMCVPCSSGHVGSREHNTSGIGDVEVVNFGRGNTLCCVKHADNWLHLIKLFQGQNRVEKEVIGSKLNATQGFEIEQKEDRASAHLFLNQKTFTGDAMKWSLEPGYNTAHVTGAMKLVNDSLHIQEDGFYFVYTSVSLVTRDTDGDVITNHVTHSVSRNNATTPGKTELLLSRLAVLSNTPGQLTSSCLEENIHLRSGDLLTVQLSNYSYIFNFSLSNFFGIYRL